MVEVTATKPQKNQKRVNVFLDGKYCFSLDLETFLKSGLKAGQILTQKELEKFLFTSFFEKLKARSLNFLSYRPRSEKEVSNYLDQKLFKLSVVEQKFKKLLKEKVIDDLKRQKLINDQDFALWWRDQRLGFKNFGREKIRVELRQKGIKKEIIDKVLEKISEKELLKMAGTLIAKKIKNLKELEDRKIKKHLVDYLQRRGFNWPTIKKAIDDFKTKD